MKGDYQRNRFICEGCGAEAAGRPLPDGWGPMAVESEDGKTLICQGCAEQIADFYGRARERKRAEVTERTLAEQEVELERLEGLLNTAEQTIIEQAGEIARLKAEKEGA